jgi:short-subunit dehydrogenase
MGGRLTFPLYSPYHSTKWAVEGFSESLQYELEPFGIRVKLIEPGVIKTDFYDRSATIAQLDAYEGFVKTVLPRMTDASQIGERPEKVAQVIYRAATDRSRRLRYSVGIDAKVFLTVKRLLGDRIFSKIVRSSLLR